ncbi:MAG: DUF512 domain-containing protein [Lachnospiraceae bacterium]|nr:DUF512 domain-containing protein [Lachnospiraceae bacterium]
MRKKGHVIYKVKEDSIAYEMGLEPGDMLIAVNGVEIEDIFDYDYAIEEEYLELYVRKADGEEFILEIEKEENEDLGIIFENSLMDDYKSCSNKCIFCFIDQMPPGMRETLYFKDDDSRLSFLQGNYITMTNMKEKDVERIIRFHMSPINISVHTTNPELRKKMLHNRFAGKVLKYIDRFYDAGITMNGQIVLCPEVNDGRELEKTITDLAKYAPVMQSLSVVPVGVTKYRDGLYPMKTFNAQTAGEVIDIIESFQTKMFDELGIHFVHASDEFYLLAGREVPEEERYDDYCQLENGVGMTRLFREEFISTLNELPKDFAPEKRSVSVITGYLAYDNIKLLTDMLVNKYDNIKVNVYKIRNDFFGETITVSGLVTGQDIIKQLSGIQLGDALLIPINMLRSQERVFLDDVTVDDVQNALQVNVNIVKSSGLDLVYNILGISAGDISLEDRFRPYEADSV